jgi:hypothetical protein
MYLKINKKAITALKYVCREKRLDRGFKTLL